MITSTKRILRIKQLIQIVGLGRSTIYDYLNPKSARYDSSFPKPIKIGAAAVGWLESEVNQWLDLKALTSRQSKHSESEVRQTLTLREIATRTP